MDALTALGFWHLEGEEGLEQDDFKATALFREAADRGDTIAETRLAACYFEGTGVEQSYALAAEWGRKAADQGDAGAQFFVGTLYARGKEGVKKDLPMGKMYLELCAAQGYGDAVAALKELRKCASCGTLDVHHMICAWCRNVRYCDGRCQLQHWQRLADPHKPHCGRRREVAGAEGVSSYPSTDNEVCVTEEALEVAATAAAAKIDAAKAAVAVARTAAGAALTESQSMAAAAQTAVTAVVAAMGAVEGAPAASKKEKKKKAKLVAKLKVVKTAAEAALEASSEAGAARKAAEAVLQAALQTVA